LRAYVQGVSGEPERWDRMVNLSLATESGIKMARRCVLMAGLMFIAVVLLATACAGETHASRGAQVRWVQDMYVAVHKPRRPGEPSLEGWVTVAASKQSLPGFLKLLEDDRPRLAKQAKEAVGQGGWPAGTAEKLRGAPKEVLAAILCARQTPPDPKEPLYLFMLRNGKPALARAVSVDPDGRVALLYNREAQRSLQWLGESLGKAAYESLAPQPDEDVAVYFGNVRSLKEGSTFPTGPDDAEGGREAEEWYVGPLCTQRIGSLHLPGQWLQTTAGTDAAFWSAEYGPAIRIGHTDRSVLVAGYILMPRDKVLLAAGVDQCIKSGSSAVGHLAIPSEGRLPELAEDLQFSPGDHTIELEQFGVGEPQYTRYAVGEKKETLETVCVKGGSASYKKSAVTLDAFKALWRKTCRLYSLSKPYESLHPTTAAPSKEHWSLTLRYYRGSVTVRLTNEDPPAMVQELKALAKELDDRLK